jgi:hypothetical protein
MITLYIYIYTYPAYCCLPHTARIVITHSLFLSRSAAGITTTTTTTVALRIALRHNGSSYTRLLYASLKQPHPVPDLGWSFRLTVPISGATGICPTHLL